MFLTDSPTEMTSGLTDAVLSLECLAILVCLRRQEVHDSWRVALWSWVFGLTAFASLLGAIVHVFVLPDLVLAVLWRPLYLSLGILIALFLVAAVYDWRGYLATARLIPFGIGAGIAFFAATEIAQREFFVFVAYEAALLAGAAAIYLYLGAARRVKGALLVALAILISVTAGGLQATELAVEGPIPLDHNGLFHLVQMAGTALLGVGVSRGMRK